MKPICALALCWLAAISATGTVNRQWAVGGEHKNPYDEILHTPEKSGGIYYAYPVTADQEPAIPGGYHPVAIVHYGRHGSRWAIKEAQYDIADSIFNYFQSRQLLTPLGTDMKRRIAIIGKHARGHSGELSPVGERQHRHIANRMLKRFPSLFVDSARIEARSSVEPRCIMSMAAFCEQLKEINPKLQIQRHATPADMDFIAYSTAEAKAHGNPSAQWRKTKYRFIDSVLTPDRFLTALITDTCGITPRQGRYMMQLLHDIAIAIQDVDGLDGMQIWDAFTPDEIYNLWQIVNYEMYFRHASATGNGNHGKQSAYSLLSHIITTADSALNGKLPAVNLHFGHDTNLIRLLALMGIDGCDNASDNPDNFALAWQGFRVSPMGANLQLVFYSNNNGNVLTLIRHNEQTATLPLEQQATGMYDWIKLKQFWTQRLKAIKHQKNTIPCAK